MQRRIFPFIAFLLIISIGNYTRLSGNENVRSIQFLSIFCIGVFSSLLIVSLVTILKKRNTKTD
jgi:hypothetical protein